MSDTDRVVAGCISVFFKLLNFKNSHTHIQFHKQHPRTILNICLNTCKINFTQLNVWKSLHSCWSAQIFDECNFEVSRSTLSSTLDQIEIGWILLKKVSGRYWAWPVLGEVTISILLDDTLSKMLIYNYKLVYKSIILVF